VNQWIEDLLDRSARDKVLYLAGAVLLVFAAGYATLLRGQWARYSAVSSELRASRQRVEEFTAKGSNLGALRQSVHKLDLELQAALARLPDRKEIPDLLNNLSELASASGLLITKFKQREERVQEYYAEVPVELSMRGSFHQVAAFFDKVPRLNRLVNVTDIAFRKPQVVNDDVQIDTSCVATTFRFLDEEERARVAAERKKQQQQTKKGQAPAHQPRK
jgi:type IV pilus assembly protein PilO